MYRTISIRRTVGPLLAATMFFTTFHDVRELAAQGTKPRPTRLPSSQPLDAKTKKVQEGFLRETAALAKEYEAAGHLDKSKSLYEIILKIDDSLPGIKEKIADLNNEILNSNDFKFELNASSDWSAPVALVFKGRPIRIQADGEYRLTLDLTLDAGGLSVGDQPGMMPKGIPFGALTGVIVTNNKPGEPFTVGQQLEMTPKADGFLLLKLNAPPKLRANGRLSLQMSGYTKQIGDR